MERRHFLKLAIGVAAGAATLAAAAQAAPLLPQSPADRLPSPPGADTHPAVATGDEADRLQPEEVRWGRHRRWHRRHWGWRRRHWGWHRRRWHRRRHWRRHHW